MIPLLIGTIAVTAAGIGWYGYKASVRIAAWGQKMNETDRIFQMAEECEQAPDLLAGRVMGSEDARARKPYVGPHVPAGIAPLR